MKVIKKEQEEVFEAFELNVKVKYFQDDEEQTFNIGDWLVRDKTGDARYYTNEEFERLFEKKPKKLLLD